MTQEQEDYIKAQDEWIENVGGLRKGDDLLVMASATSNQAGWAHEWQTSQEKLVGRTVQYHRPCDLAKQGGLMVHSFGMKVCMPFFVLMKVDKNPPRKAKP